VFIDRCWQSTTTRFFGKATSQMIEGVRIRIDVCRTPVERSIAVVGPEPVRSPVVATATHTTADCAENCQDDADDDENPADRDEDGHWDNEPDDDENNSENNQGDSCVLWPC